VSSYGLGARDIAVGQASSQKTYSDFFHYVYSDFTPVHCGPVRLSRCGNDEFTWAGQFDGKEFLAEVVYEPNGINRGNESANGCIHTCNFREFRKAWRQELCIKASAVKLLIVDTFGGKANFT
jgi:hypothetical protein